jgi:hypothetical protein
MTVAERDRSVPRRARYDWRKWVDGEQHTAKLGVDFHCQAPSFVALLHYQAKARRFDRVETSTSEDGNAVTFQFIQGAEAADQD